MNSASIEHRVRKPWAVTQGFPTGETSLLLVKQGFIAVCKKMPWLITQRWTRLLTWASLGDRQSVEILVCTSLD